MGLAATLAHSGPKPPTGGVGVGRMAHKLCNPVLSAPPRGGWPNGHKFPNPRGWPLRARGPAPNPTPGGGASAPQTPPPSAPRGGPTGPQTTHQVVAHSGQGWGTVCLPCQTRIPRGSGALRHQRADWTESASESGALRPTSGPSGTKTPPLGVGHHGPTKPGEWAFGATEESGGVYRRGGR